MTHEKGKQALKILLAMLAKKTTTEQALNALKELGKERKEPVQEEVVF